MPSDDDMHQFINCGVAKWEGAGLISRQRVGSIPASATNYPFNGLLDHSGGHLPRKQESGERSPGSPPFFQSREGWEPGESHKLADRGSSPRPATTFMGV